MSEEARLLGGRYQLGDVIGRGGMAEVHRGTDLRLGREVAVKVLRQDLARDPAFLTRFRREAHAAASLNHPNVVSVYDTGEDEVEVGINRINVPWIVMEYVDGITLRQVLQSGHKIEPPRALDITIGVLAALDYSHRRGIIHRDIKPGNVMLTKQGAVKVMDFGIARAIADASATMTQTNTVLGTAQYLSPEQARGETVDARSDLYSAGCLLYELLTGKPPFVGDSPMAIAYQHVAEELVPPSSVNPEVPPTFDVVLKKSMAKSPDQRYQTAAEMRADLEALLTGGSVAAQEVDSDATAKLPTTKGAMRGPTNEGEKSMTSPGFFKSKLSGGALAWILGAVLTVVGALFLVAKLISPTPVDTVTVPNLAGLTSEAAAAALEDVGLALGQTTYEIAEDRPENTVISQNPTAQTEVDKGSAVDIVLAKGKDQVQVPTLVNFASPDDARAALDEVGLNLGAVNFEDSDLPANTVLRSDPAAGSYVDVGSSVAIWVSSGKIAIPNVLTLSQAEATNQLYNLGFIVNVVEREDDTVEAGIVLEQNPLAGTSALPGTTVTIVVSKLPADPTDNPTP